MNNHRAHIPLKATASENEYAQYEAALLTQVSAAIASSAAFFALDDDTMYSGRAAGSTTIKRKRRDMEEYLDRMDDICN